MLDRELKTCFCNWFVFHCKTNYIQCSSSSTCLWRGNHIGIGGSCSLHGHLHQYLWQVHRYLCSFCVCIGSKRFKALNHLYLVIHLNAHHSHQAYAAYPSKSQQHCRTKEEFIAAQLNNLCVEVVAINVFWLLQRFSEMPPKELKFWMVLNLKCGKCNEGLPPPPLNPKAKGPSFLFH